MASPLTDDGRDRRRDASKADAALVEDRRRHAARRLVHEAGTASSPDAASADERPLFEATTNALGGDVDAAGQRLLVWPDRVELRDGRDRLRSRIAIEAIEQVDVRKRLTSATLTVRGTAGERLVLKGVKPAAATRFRDTVAGVGRPSGPGSASTSTAEALRRLDELAARGLLTDKEVAQERSLLAHRSLRPQD